MLVICVITYYSDMLTFHFNSFHAVHFNLIFKRKFLFTLNERCLYITTMYYVNLAVDSVFLSWGKPLTTTNLCMHALFLINVENVYLDLH